MPEEQNATSGQEKHVSFVGSLFVILSYDTIWSCTQVKMQNLSLVFWATTVTIAVECLHHRGPLRTMFAKEVPPMVLNGIDPGEPLFLTPYLEQGKIEEGKQMSLVSPLKGVEEVKSYAAYLTVNKQYNSNMFFWFFPAKVHPTESPLLLWLQGGPGGSSLFGLFIENGPFYVDKENALHLRNYSWTNKYNMLYIDNPVGTGFSFTKEDAGYATNETDVGRDLYNALTQFFQIYSEYKDCDFYITGESYAGKYIPAIGYKIHMENPTADIKINFKGVAIGDGLCDPETMLPAYGELLFQIGMLDENQKAYFNNMTDTGVKYIQNKKWLDAFMIFDSLLNGDTIPYPSYFTNVTGSTFYYNYLLSKEPEEYSYFNKLLALPEVRKAIHVGNLPFNAGDVVEKHLLNDIMQTMKPQVAVLMDKYKVLMYSGQLDIIVGLPLTEAFLQTVPWSGLDLYKKVTRSIWRLNQGDVEVAGYARQVVNFFQVMVRGAGHILPYDQPARAFDMIERFISDKGFH